MTHLSSKKKIPSYTDDDRIVPSHWVPKKPSEWTDTEKEKVALDDHLQLILLDSLSNDKFLYGNVITCNSAYDMWKKIELLCEGSEEVRENQKQILVSQYEAFMANQGEELTIMFERFSKLLSELQSMGSIMTRRKSI